MFLKRSCCCYSLQHGTVIIGIIFMISSAVALLLEIGLIAEWSDIKDYVEDDRKIIVSLPVLIASLALSLVYMIFSVVMLKGVKEQKKVYFLPWMVWSVLYFLISLGIFIYSIVLGGETWVQKLVPPLVYLLITSLWVYCFVCVVAYYTYLKKHPNSRQVEFELLEDPDSFTHLRSLSQRRIFPHSIWEDTSETTGTNPMSRKMTSFRETAPPKSKKKPVVPATSN